jgi:hypothetical protein
MVHAQGLGDLDRSVSAAVVDKQHLVRLAEFRKHGVEPFAQRRHVFDLVVDRHNY